MSELRVHTVLTGRGPAAAILLTDEQVASFGAGKTFPVAVTIGGRTARLRLARMGGENMIGLSKAARADLGVEIDQEVDAVIRLDTAERTVEVPPALAAALDADPAVRAAFDALSPSARKEHARAVADAKQDATRDRRIAKIVESLRG
ncbi:YdeI/OmpD-associated family protein [Microbacterium paraoxydans]|uniref:YdeI/OmpD-associated family protein n=1 Tax=Microbacterium TaxID=33882 RepID=UPI00228693EB|nr:MULTISPECIES: YdeI/OmpD-associated family protein [Microbacterium]MCZ0710066.1 YdeI/OmpD-associated family protein [Microbacterium paraoxydans]MDH5132477.1 YdeI/OmpD-associated family protein [Microbacterium sp. RD10]MDH5137954.1 YdeI/OmpD-associated family protein [Microbacterium sp. RD11]MDH5144860.1 YdeI/OmpD-associated family protein [Microbacterium sp. RD12]MDH5154405.1 YdeI/OmpD-associated family protein [Microbacterium sp. RD06]